MIEVGEFFPAAGEATTQAEALALSDMARGMTGSKILQIAYAVQTRKKAGERVADFTVGDFSPEQFRVPPALIDFTEQALRDGHTNYPPADGIVELREAIRDQLKRELGLSYPADAIVVGSGARPLLYGAFRCLINPGEKVVYPAPSWNNKNFCQLVGARNVVVPTRPEDSFMPTAASLKDALVGARLLVLCSPSNPCGTMIREPQMRAICEAVVEENQRREAKGERLLYVIYDQVYRLLRFGALEHVTPVGVMPEMARYTLLTDAISKSFAGTGLRVGWMVAPPFIARQLKSLGTHVGAWAPRPEQYATARLLNSPDLMDAYLTTFKAGLARRLTLLADAFRAWKAEGLPVDCIAPEGAIYLSVKFDLEGRPGLPDEDAVRLYLLEKAGCAIVPFSAFGDSVNKGWVRFSVGAVGPEDIEHCLPRLHAALVEAVKS